MVSNHDHSATQPNSLEPTNLFLVTSFSIITILLMVDLR